MKKLTSFLPLILIFLIQTNVAFAQNIEWAKNVQIPYSTGQPIVVDQLGNSFVFGNFIDTCTFGSFTLIGNGSYDMYLAKYNPQGVIQWVNKIDGQSNETAEDICLDRTGNIYLTGYYQSYTNFNGVVLPGEGSYIAKYTSSGSLVWVNSIDSLNGTYSHKIVVSDSGSIFVAGNLYTQTNFGCAILSPSIYENQFIARYDSNGNCQWAKMFITPYVFDISIDQKNCVYVTGVVIGQGTFGTNTILSHGGQDIFLAKCYANGTWAWATSIGSAYYDQGLGVTVDNYGHIYLTGYFTESASFGNSTLISTGTADIFIACYNELGNCLWAKQAGGGYGNQYGFGITSDFKGNCFITGSIIDTTHFGSYTIIPNGEKTFVAKYDSLGTCIWALESNGDSGDRGLDIKTDSLDNLFLTGILFSPGNYSFGNYIFSIPLTQACSNNLNVCTNVFVLKINSSIVSVKEMDSDDNHIKIYPNPTSSIINISEEQNELQNSTITIQNNLGQSVFNSPFTSRIDLSGLSVGMYFLTVSAKDFCKTIKVTKE